MLEGSQFGVLISGSKVFNSRPVGKRRMYQCFYWWSLGDISFGTTGVCQHLDIVSWMFLNRISNCKLQHLCIISGLSPVPFSSVWNHWEIYKHTWMLIYGIWKNQSCKIVTFSCLSSDFLSNICCFFSRSTPLLWIASIVMCSLRISEWYQLFQLQSLERFVSAILCLWNYCIFCHYVMIKPTKSLGIPSGSCSIWFKLYYLALLPITSHS